ncbi:MAG: hypothetical protein SFY56_12385 [Bacteroidota bacterium]|nr:hypothetical protein [Bacteroidota bacterium]
MLFIPTIFTQPSFYSFFNFGKTGPIGDTIGGITAPFINFIGAVLVYFSFQQQIKANEIQKDSLKEEVKRNENERKYNSIIHDINNLRTDINDFQFSRQIEYYGTPALFEFKKYCSLSNKKTLEDLIPTPTFMSFYFLIASTDNILTKIINSNIEESDKKDLQEKLIYLFSSKISADGVSIIKSFVDRDVKHQFIEMLYNTIQKLGTYIVNSGI